MIAAVVILSLLFGAMAKLRRNGDRLARQDPNPNTVKKEEEIDPSDWLQLPFKLQANLLFAVLAALVPLPPLIKSLLSM